MALRREALRRFFLGSDEPVIIGKRTDRATKCLLARTRGVAYRRSGPAGGPELDDGAQEPAVVSDDMGPDLAALFVRYQAELVRLALLLVGDQATAEDVVQDVFARLHARRALGPSDADALPYVRAAVLNGCRSQLRRRAVARRFAGAHDGRLENVTQDSAEQELMRSEERAQILAALAALPFRRREVLILRYYLGLSVAEIAQVLGISPGTVKSSAARGLAALARSLGEKHEQP
jgi:RNA polymerase sigma-70 factor (sigma-E family)